MVFVWMESWLDRFGRPATFRPELALRYFSKPAAITFHRLLPAPEDANLLPMKALIAILQRLFRKQETVPRVCTRLMQ